MKNSYLIKIFTREIQTKFYVDTEKPIDTMDQLHKVIIDFLGKNDIKWEPNSLQFNGTARGGDFYITYEEVDNGKRQDATVREKDSVRV